MRRPRKNYYKKLNSNYELIQVNGYNALRDIRTGELALTLSLISEGALVVAQGALSRCNTIERRLGKLAPLEYAPNYYSTRRVRIFKKEFIVPILADWNEAADEFLAALGWTINDAPPLPDTKIELERTDYVMVNQIGVDYYINTHKAGIFFSLPNMAKLANMTASAANFKYRKLCEKGYLTALPVKIPTERGIRLMHCLDIHSAKRFVEDIKDEETRKDCYNKIEMLRVLSS